MDQNKSRAEKKPDDPNKSYETESEFAWFTTNHSLHQTHTVKVVSYTDKNITSNCRDL